MRTQVYDTYITTERIVTRWLSLKNTQRMTRAKEHRYATKGLGNSLRDSYDANISRIFFTHYLCVCK